LDAQLTLVIPPLVFARISFPNQFQTATKAAKLMLNAQSMQSITICMKTVKLVFVTNPLDLALQKMIPQPTAKNAKLIANQVPIAMMQNVLGLETPINANILQRIVMMEKLVPLILAIQQLDNALISTIVPILFVTLTSIVLPGQAQILNSLQIA